MKLITILATCAALGGFAVLPASAQERLGPANNTGTIIQNEDNATGGDRGVVISRGATGADTINTDSAAGGNAGRPEQALPNSSGGGGGR